MSQRGSGYERLERDLYETPEWVTDCVIGYIDAQRPVWEPACGSGKMVRALEEHNLSVCGTDIEQGQDFLKAVCLPHPKIATIVTNPPYALAREFIQQAIELTEPVAGAVAMLLRTDFDHAKSRQHLFGLCKQFSNKVVLTKRITWFEHSKGQPSFNHAWFIWDWKHKGAPILAYAPSPLALTG